MASRQRIKGVKNRAQVTSQPIDLATQGSALGALVRSLRPQQWVKNLLVFASLIFSPSLLHWDAARLSIGAFLMFCLASSGIYLLNDWRDVQEDRLHPVKRLRPLASGAIRPSTAMVTMGVLLTWACLGALLLHPAFALILGIYILLNVAYSFGLKRVVMLDVGLVALGCVLRAVAGAVVLGAQPAPWLVLCTFMFALLIGFGKRRHELILLQTEAAKHRQSLARYSVRYLDLMMAITAASTIVTYSCFTLTTVGVGCCGPHGLVLTNSLVLYGILHYRYLVYEHHAGGDPARLFLTDPATLVSSALWVLMVYCTLYGPSGWLL